MLRIMQERTRCETKYTVFEHFFMHLSDIDFLHPCTSNYLKNLLPWVYITLFPFHKLQRLLNSFRIVMNTATLKYTYTDF